eukprot:1258522-Rhodomonas_salina.3
MPPKMRIGLAGDSALRQRGEALSRQESTGPRVACLRGGRIVRELIVQRIKRVGRIQYIVVSIHYYY